MSQPVCNSVRQDKFVVREGKARKDKETLWWLLSLLSLKWKIFLSLCFIAKYLRKTIKERGGLVLAYDSGVTYCRTSIWPCHVADRVQREYWLPVWYEGESVLHVLFVFSDLSSSSCKPTNIQAQDIHPNDVNH